MGTPSVSELIAVLINRFELWHGSLDELDGHRSVKERAMRAFVVQLQSGWRYWTLLDDGRRPHR